MRRGVVYLLFGLPSAGKTTVARALSQRLERCIVLDGDALRQGLCSDLGFSRDDRRENLRRAMHCARLISLAGADVVVAMIAPYREDREMAKKICEGLPYLEVFLDCPLEECIRRDAKGLYRRAMEGKLANFTGLDGEFEPPDGPVLVIRTDLCSPWEAASLILGASKAEG